MIPGTIHEGIIPSYNFSIDKNAYTSAIASSNINTTTDTTDTTKSAASAAIAITTATSASSSSNMIFEYQNTLLSKRSLDEAFGTDLDSSSSENPGVYSSFLMSSSSSSSSESDLITPPNSTLRKPGKRQCTKSRSDPPVRPSIIVIDSTKEPLTPGKSPPFSKNGSNNNNTVTKKQHKSESARSNSNLSIDEIVDSLRRRKLNSEVDKKPPYSYAVLICLAILQSPEGKLTLSQIYNWISTHFPFYKPRDASWQNSIRHNLSLNEAFVKTQKSLDGKGHFWEVKESSAPKFFKGEESGYDGIRRKLRSLEGYFHSVTAMAVTTSTTTTTTTTDPGTEILVSTTTTNLDNSLDNAVPIFSSKNSNSNSNSDPKSKSKSQSKSKEDRTIDSGKLEGTVSSVERRGSDKYPIEISSLGFSTEPHLDPPRRFRFTGQQFANSLSPIRVPPTASGLNLSLSPILPPPPPPSSSSSQPQVSTSSSLTSFSMFGSNQTLLRSPQNTYKRNNGSLSPGFGELSPFSVRTDTNILLPPPQPSTAFSPTSSILNGSNSNSNGSSSLYNPSGTNKLPLLIPPSQQQQQQQQQQFDPLKTPELLMNHTFDRSPCRFVISPAENDTVSRRWQQTPSHLFEDIYTSPIFRAMGRSSKVIATPNGSTVIKRSSPVRQNGGKGLETPLRSKLSCSGLFGVDVVSVWKRAIQTVGKDNDKDKDKPEKKGHTEEDKENSKDRGENSTNKKSSTPSEDSKSSGKTGDKGQFELKLDVPFQVRHHST